MGHRIKYIALFLTCSAFSACNRPTADTHTVNKPSLTTGAASSDGNDSAVQSLQPTAQQVTLKTVVPEKVRVGQSYQYEVHVTNSDKVAAVRDVKVRHTLPEGFSIESSEPKPDSQEQVAIWTFSELGPGETRKIAIVGSSDSEGMQHTCLSVTYTPAVCIETHFVEPDIGIVKQAPETGTLCEPIIVTYQLNNSGSGTAKSVTVKDELPDGLTTAEGEKIVTFTIDELAADKQVEVTKSLVATAAGEFSSRAVATTQEGEESRSSRITTKIVAAELDVSVEGPSSEYIGRVLNYKVRVTNTGNAPAEGAVVSLAFPEGARFAWTSQANITASKDNQIHPKKAPDVEGKPTVAEAAQAIAGVLNEAERAVVWNLGTLPAGQTAEASVSFAGQRQGDLKYTATAKFTCGQNSQTKATASTQTNLFALPALSINVVDTPDPVRVGEELRYIITVFNEGSGEESDVTVTATLPEGLQHQSHSGKTNGQLDGQNLTFEKVDTLKAGERAQWTVIAKGKIEGDTKLSVKMTSKTQGESTVEEPTNVFRAME